MKLMFFLNLLQIIFVCFYKNNINVLCDEISSCPTNINVKLYFDAWTGDLEIVSNVIEDGVNLNLIFNEDVIISEIKPRFTDNKKYDINHILLSNGEVLELLMHIIYQDSIELPILNQIELNGVKICVRTDNKEIAIFGRPTNSTPSPLNSGFIPVTRETSTYKPILMLSKHPIISSMVNFHLTNSFYVPSECGIVIPETKPLIFLGQKSYSGEFPWHTAIFFVTENNFSYICGGSLITNDFILTAAHCTTVLGSTKSISSDNLVVYLGKHILHRFSENEQNFKIEKILNHPDFDANRFYADISLLKLIRSVKLTNFVRPICLWNFDTDFDLLTNKLGTIPGFGYNENGTLTEQLSNVQMPIVSFQDCIWSKPDFYSRVTSDKSFCAGFKNGSSVCNGDSGGGMVFEKNSRWYLRGVVSVGAAQQGNRIKCDPLSYVVFTDVAKFIPWINTNILM